MKDEQWISFRCRYIWIYSRCFGWFFLPVIWLMNELCFIPLTYVACVYYHSINLCMCYSVHFKWIGALSLDFCHKWIWALSQDFVITNEFGFKTFLRRLARSHIMLLVVWWDDPVPSVSLERRCLLVRTPTWMRGLLLLVLLLAFISLIKECGYFIVL